METANQICITLPSSVMTIIASVIIGVGYINNLIPAPDTITNPVLKFISRITHFIGTDIVTAVKK